MAASKLQKQWEERITAAKKKREDWDTEFKTQMGRDYFEGRNNPGYPPAEWINVNKIYAHLSAQLPLLYSIDPYFYVKVSKSYKPDTASIAQFEANAKIRQSYLNYLKKELDLKSKARLGILDAHFEFGVLKVRYAADQKKLENAGKPITGEDGKAQKDPETGETMVYPDTVPINERYEICRVHPKDIIFDEDAGPLEDSWKWIAQHICIRKKEALKDPRYKKSAVRSIKPKPKDDKGKKSGIVSAVRSWLSQEEKDEEEYIDIWEVYDLYEKQWLSVGEDAEELLMDPRPVPKGVERHPYSFLGFMPRDNSPYPIPPVFNALDPQKEYSLSRSRLLTHRKRFNRKYEVDTNKLMDENEISKLESGDDGTFIRVQQQGAVNPIQDAPLDQMGLQEIMFLNNDLVEIFGTPSQARGVADADSATEASILDKRLEVREGDKLSMVVDWITAAAKKLDQLVQAHIEKDEAVRIAGPQGEFWQVVRKDDYQEIAGEFEYTTNVGASQPRLPDIERAQLTAFLSQVVIPMPHVLTLPSFMKRVAEMYHIEDEAMLEELRAIGEKMLNGAVPMPGGQGGGPSNNPVAAILGAAGGPGGGNVNGGGA